MDWKPEFDPAKMSPLWYLASSVITALVISSLIVAFIVVAKRVL